VKPSKHHNELLLAVNSRPLSLDAFCQRKQRLINGDDWDLAWIEKGRNLANNIHSMLYHCRAVCFLIKERKKCGNGGENVLLLKIIRVITSQSVL
jgi:hypothetical protein